MRLRTILAVAALAAALPGLVIVAGQEPANSPTPPKLNVPPVSIPLGLPEMTAPDDDPTLAAECTGTVVNNPGGGSCSRALASFGNEPGSIESLILWYCPPATSGCTPTNGAISGSMSGEHQGAATHYTSPQYSYQSGSYAGTLCGLGTGAGGNPNWFDEMSAHLLGDPLEYGCSASGYFGARAQYFEQSQS